MIQKIEPPMKLEAQALAIAWSTTAEAVQVFCSRRTTPWVEFWPHGLPAKGYKIKPLCSPPYYAVKDGCSYKLRLASKPDNNANRRIDIAASKSQSSERQGFIVWAGVIHPSHYTGEGWSFLEEDIDRSQLKRQSDWKALKEYLQKHEAKPQAK
jgi:hypothetical protein